MASAAGWYTGSASAVVGLALFYGGLGQLLAGMWEFRNGNTFAAAAFASYGCFWLAYGWGLQNNQFGNAQGVGFFFLAWGIFTFLWFLGTLRTNLALMGVFLFLTLTFFALAVGALNDSSTWTKIGGYLGLITAVLAWYTAAANMLAAGKTAFKLPLFPVE
jgi:succinate-acetate transporter protein